MVESYHYLKQLVPKASTMGCQSECTAERSLLTAPEASHFAFVSKSIPRGYANSGLTVPRSSVQFTLNPRFFSLKTLVYIKIALCHLYTPTPLILIFLLWSFCNPSELISFSSFFESSSNLYVTFRLPFFFFFFSNTRARRILLKVLNKVCIEPVNPAFSRASLSKDWCLQKSKCVL